MCPDRYHSKIQHLTHTVSLGKSLNLFPLYMHSHCLFTVSAGRHQFPHGWSIENVRLVD